MSTKEIATKLAEIKKAYKAGEISYLMAEHLAGPLVAELNIKSYILSATFSTKTLQTLMPSNCIK